MNSIAIIFLGAMCLAVQQGVDGINCYSCSQGTDGCGPTFSKTGNGVIPTSDSTPVYCSKTVATSNTNAIVRSYNTLGTCTEGSYTNNGIVTYQYCCTTDLCNGASMEKASFIIAVTTALISMLLIK